MPAAAGMVVTEMALAWDCRMETTPTNPASIATDTEERLGWLIRSETGRMPRVMSPQAGIEGRWSARATRPRPPATGRESTGWPRHEGAIHRAHRTG
jgi:hypothetical protein